jgi:hypothetical protein
VRFEVEYVFRNSKHPYLLARQLDAGDFRVDAGARLNGIPVQPGVTQPRARTDDGYMRLDVFAFHLVNAEDLAQFMVGQIVELGP